MNRLVRMVAYAAATVGMIAIHHSDYALTIALVGMGVEIGEEIMGVLNARKR